MPDLLRSVAPDRCGRGGLPVTVVAIDGPAGAGKSTVAARIAARYGLLNLETGAMYRAFALKAIQTDSDLDDREELGRLAERRISPPSGSGIPRNPIKLPRRQRSLIYAEIDHAALARPTSAQISASACARCSMSASVWCGDGVIRSRSVPRGTVG